MPVASIEFSSAAMIIMREPANKYTKQNTISSKVKNPTEHLSFILAVQQPSRERNTPKHAVKMQNRI